MSFTKVLVPTGKAGLDCFSCANDFNSLAYGAFQVTSVHAGLYQTLC